MADQRSRVAEYVRAILLNEGRTADDLESLIVENESSIPPTDAPGTLVASDVDVVRKVERGEALTEQEQIRLEAVVLPDLRPAFDIDTDSFAPLPEHWRRLNDHKPALSTLIKGVGRVDLVGHPSLTIAGTACVAAPDLLMTNRHVAEHFAEASGAQLQFKPGMSASVDLKHEVGNASSIVLHVVAPAEILHSWDVALLRVAGLPNGIAPLPFAGGAPSVVDGRLAAVVGYPLMDDSSNILDQIRIFRGVFFKKRLMPGTLRGFRSVDSFGLQVSALTHDCTTLGGNSGSPLIDVESEVIAGIHFAGKFLDMNFAVPSWELAKDVRFKNAGVTFV